MRQADDIDHQLRARYAHLTELSAARIASCPEVTRRGDGLLPTKYEQRDHVPLWRDCKGRRRSPRQTTRRAT